MVRLGEGQANHLKNVINGLEGAREGIGAHAFDKKAERPSTNKMVHMGKRCRDFLEAMKATRTIKGDTEEEVRKALMGIDVVDGYSGDTGATNAITSNLSTYQFASRVYPAYRSATGVPAHNQPLFITEDRVCHASGNGDVLGVKVQQPGGSPPRTSRTRPTSSTMTLGGIRVPLAKAATPTGRARLHEVIRRSSSRTGTTRPPTSVHTSLDADRQGRGRGRGGRPGRRPQGGRLLPVKRSMPGSG